MACISKRKLNNSLMAALFLGISMLFSGQLHADDTSISQVNHVNKRNETTQITSQEFIQILLNDQKFQEARMLLRQLNSSQEDLLYLEVEIALFQGNLGKAAEYLEFLLERQPENYFLRAKLADIYRFDSAYLSSSRQYEILSTSLPDSEERQIAGERAHVFGKRFISDWWWGGDLTPSQNINNASEKTVANLGILPERLQPQSGWYARVKFGGYLSYQLKDHHRLVLSANYERNFYTYETLDSEIAELNLSWKYQNARDQVSFTIGRGKFWGDGEIYATRIHSIPDRSASAIILKRNENYSFDRVSLSLKRRVTPKFTLGVAGTRRWKIHADQDQYGYADSVASEIITQFEYVPNLKSKFSLDVIYQRTREKGIEDSYVTQNGFVGRGLGVGFERILNESTKIAIDLSYLKRKYDAPHNLVFGAYERDDEVYSIGGRYINSNWKIGKVQPTISCKYALEKSNIVDFERSNIGCGFEFSW